MLQDLLFFVDNYSIAIEQRVKIPHKKNPIKLWEIHFSVPYGAKYIILSRAR